MSGCSRDRGDDEVHHRLERRALLAFVEGPEAAIHGGCRPRRRHDAEQVLAPALAANGRPRDRGTCRRATARAAGTAPRPASIVAQLVQRRRRCRATRAGLAPARARATYVSTDRASGLNGSGSGSRPSSVSVAVPRASQLAPLDARDAGDERQVIVGAPLLAAAARPRTHVAVIHRLGIVRARDFPRGLARPSPAADRARGARRRA